MQEEPMLLEWMDEKAREKILNHPDLINYNSNAPHRTIFVPVIKVSELSFPKFTKKQYIGYGVEQAPLHLIHPIQHAYVRLQIRQLQLLYRFKNAINFHMNFPFQCVQKIYDQTQLHFKKEQFTVLNVCCENYKFTLADALELIRNNQVEAFSTNFIPFVRAFIFRCYLSILQGINSPKASQLCLYFSFDPKNIFIDEFFKLMLGNPIFGNGYPVPLVAFEDDKEEKYIHSGILEDMKNLLGEVLRNVRLKEVPEITKDITYLFFNRKQQFLKVNNEIEQTIQAISTYQLAFEFPDQTILPQLRKIEYKLALVNEKSKFQVSQLQRDRAYLRKVSQSYA